MELIKENNNEIATTVYVQFHPESLETLKNAPSKNSESEVSHIEKPNNILKDSPTIPSSFTIWVDVNMSIKLKTTNHPEGEWVTLWCDDEPSPSEGEEKYFFWCWWKSSFEKNQDILKKYGVPIVKTEYCWCAPCAIAIPYDYVIEDPYRKR